MPDAATLFVFAVAAIVLLVVPGPSVLYVVAQSIDGGRRAGLAAMLGIETGALVHVLAATVGLSAVLVRSATAFEAVTYLGAAYLVVLGIRTLLRRAHAEVVAPPNAAGRSSLRRRYGQGIVVNVLNPKTALFFLAFLPQFVDPEAGRAGAQILLLGLVFVVLAVLSDGAYAVAAGTAADALRHHPGLPSLRRWVSGTVFLGLGVAAALSGPSHRPRV